MGSSPPDVPPLSKHSAAGCLGAEIIRFLCRRRVRIAPGGGGGGGGSGGGGGDDDSGGDGVGAK